MIEFASENLEKLLKFLEDYRESIRKFLGIHRKKILGGIVLVLAIVAAGVAYDFYPKTYELTISGGEILSNRHFLARILQEEARKKGIFLTVQPVKEKDELLPDVISNKLNLAFIQGGLGTPEDGVEHVATVLPELVHLLVRGDDFKGMDDLKGKNVNMGAKGSATREIFRTVIRFAGYTENGDFVEYNFSPEQLLDMPDHKLPNAILTLSSVPSYLVDRLVQVHKYRVVEIPFPESLALRYGWASNGKILAYTYGQQPAVPAKDIVTVAVNMHLVANPTVDPKAIAALLTVLYGPSVRNVVPVDEKLIAIPSGYPLSAGLIRYLARSEPVITPESLDKLKGMLAMLVSLVSMGVAVRNWLRADEPEDKKFDEYLTALTNFEIELIRLEVEMDAPGGAAQEARLWGVREEVGKLRIAILDRLLKVKDPLLRDRTEQSARRAYEHACQLWARRAPQLGPNTRGGPPEAPRGET